MTGFHFLADQIASLRRLGHVWTPAYADSSSVAKQNSTRLWTAHFRHKYMESNGLVTHQFTAKPVSHNLSHTAIQVVGDMYIGLPAIQG